MTKAVIRKGGRVNTAEEGRPEPEKWQDEGC
jgi:hypothetical protein